MDMLGGTVGGAQTGWCKTFGTGFVRIWVCLKIRYHQMWSNWVLNHIFRWNLDGIPMQTLLSSKAI
jgi:hypothetical protein